MGIYVAQWHALLLYGYISDGLWSHFTAGVCVAVICSICDAKT